MILVLILTLDRVFSMTSPSQFVKHASYYMHLNACKHFLCIISVYMMHVIIIKWNFLQIKAKSPDSIFSSIEHFYVFLVCLTLSRVKPLVFDFKSLVLNVSGFE